MFQSAFRSRCLLYLPEETVAGEIDPECLPKIKEVDQNRDHQHAKGPQKRRIQKTHSGNLQFYDAYKNTVHNDRFAVSGAFREL